MGVYRDGAEVTIPERSDVILDSPSAGPARDVLADVREQATSQDGFVWIGLFQPTKAELATVAEVFDLDKHQVEDAGNSHQRAKVDLVRDAGFVVLKVLTYVVDTHQVEVGQVSVFVGAHHVITVRHGSPRDLRELRDHLADLPNVLEDGPYGLLHAVMDHVVDGYLRVSAQVLDEVEALEERVFSPRRADLSGAIYMLKRENLEIRRAVGPLLGPANAMVAERSGAVPASLRAAFRDIGEHVHRVADQTESTDSLLLALMSAATAKVDLQQSADQRRMAAWAALALVPTVIGSLYGMNFVFMPELEWRWGYPVVLVLTATILVLLYRNLRRAGWL
jgi:magnesium transporter